MRRFALLRCTLRTAYLLSTLASIAIPGSSAYAQAQPAIFPIPRQIPLPVEGSPQFIGDFNEDGKPDLAYSPSGNQNESILLDFAGNAPTNVTTSVCSGATFADVNNDKKLDAVSGCNGYITIQFGNGDATFQAPTYYAINGGNLTLVDLNGDGYLDIVVTQPGFQAPSQVAVLLNNGSSGPGVFSPPKQYPFPSGALGLYADDFNGDGKQDLLTTVEDPAEQNPLLAAPYSADILFGNGDGTLREATVVPGPAVESLTVGDFNGDGVTDLAGLANTASNGLYASVQIFLGSPSGTFTQGASIPVVATTRTVQGIAGPLAAVSLSDNGPLDLVVNTGVLNVFQGDG
jgi:hypothetical protein